jgi:hypothetical protein
MEIDEAIRGRRSVRKYFWKAAEVGSRVWFGGSATLDCVTSKKGDDWVSLIV